MSEFERMMEIDKKLKEMDFGFFGFLIEKNVNKDSSLSLEEWETNIEEYRAKGK